MSAFGNGLFELIKKSELNARMYEYSQLTQEEINNLSRDEYIDVLKVVHEASRDIDWNLHNYNNMLKYNGINRQPINQQFHYHNVKSPQKFSSCQKNKVRYSSIFEAYLFEIGAFVGIDYNTRVATKYFNTTRNKEMPYTPDAIAGGIFIECKGVLGSSDDYGQKYVDLAGEGHKFLFVLQHRNILIPNPANMETAPVTQEQFLEANGLKYVYADDIKGTLTTSNIVAMHAADGQNIVPLAA